MLFPGGFYLKNGEKVLTPDISLIYRWENTPLNRKMGVNVDMEGPVGLEPTTPCLKGRCSNRLSYGPALKKLIKI